MQQDLVCPSGVLAGKNIHEISSGSRPNNWNDAAGSGFDSAACCLSLALPDVFG
jgi:hypothetical protein